MNTWMYCAEITVLVCELKPYPVWFLCCCKSHPVEHWLWDMLACEQSEPRENARARGEGSRFFRVPLKRDFSRVFQIRRACLPAGDMCESYLKFYLFVYLMSHTAKRENVALLGNQLEEAKLNKDIPHKLCTVGTRCTLFCPWRWFNAFPPTSAVRCETIQTAQATHSQFLSPALWTSRMHFRARNFSGVYLLLIGSLLYFAYILWLARYLPYLGLKKVPSGDVVDFLPVVWD